MVKKYSISIVIPCYNSSLAIVELVDKINTSIFPEEIILVNDGSKDDTWEHISKLSSIHSNVTGIDLFKNSGQHNALYTGIIETAGDVIITMDDDLQHNPDNITAMLDHIKNGADLVYAIPKEEKQNIFRNFSSIASKWLFENLLKMENVANSSAYRAFTKEAAIAFEYFKGGLVDIDAILSWTVREVKLLKVDYSHRKYGNSNYNFLKLMSHASKMIVAFSSAPLIISLYLGTATLLSAIFLFIYIMWQYFIFGTTVPGFVFLALTLLFFSGVQIFLIGVFSRYIEAIHTQVSGKPIAPIRRTQRKDKN